MATTSATSDDVFQRGNFEVTNISVRTSDPSKPPVELLVVAPVTTGTYPVLLFCHGFLLTNTWYSQLLNHIASHGYIVVAPNFYGLKIISIPEEVKKASQVTEWLSSGLPLILPENVYPDFNNLALSGHSRGGKTAFALAFSKTRDDPKSSPKFKAIIGIDPVAGTAPSNRAPPKILKYVPRSLQLSIPVAVIGTGYGNQSKGLISPFAPNGVNHSEFFNESRPPTCYFLAKEYGHCDMLDDRMANYMGYICKSGEGSKDLMRRSAGGIVVAFMKAYLGGDEDDLNAIVKDYSVAPINLDPVIYVKE